METVRMQFDVPIEKAKEIELLMKECGFTKKNDFFNNAITLLKWVVRHTKKGNVIASVDEQNERYSELVMPFLEEIVASSKNIEKSDRSSAA
jgi:hypothetical protein